jgi:hypothetical protein
MRSARASCEKNSLCWFLAGSAVKKVKGLCGLDAYTWLMLHALLPADLRRKSREELKRIMEQCERALLDGTSTHHHMVTLIESEKELLRRERIDVKKTIAEAQRM